MSDTDKTFPLIMVCIVLLSLFPVAGYLAILILLSRYINRNKFGKLVDVIKKDPVLIFFMSALTISAVLSKQQFASLTGIAVFALQVTLYVIIRSVKGSRDQNFSMIRHLLLTSLVVSVYGIFQFFFIPYTDPYWLDKSLYSKITSRAFATLYNPNVLGSYLIIIIAVAATGFQIAESKYNKVITALILLAAYPCMILTYSRGAWLGAAVSILIILIFNQKKSYVLVGLAITAILAFWQYETVASRLNLEFLLSDSSQMFRWPLWKLALKIFAQHPVFGVGLGSFGFSVPSHFTAPGYLVSHAHNIYLQFLAETGLMGFLGFFGYIGMTMYVSYKLFRTSQCKQTEYLALGILAAIIGLLAHGLVDATLYLPQLNIFVWILIAVIRNIGDIELT